MTRILFVGQKPETVDFSDPALPPGFDAEKINAGIAVAVAKIGERGWQGDPFAGCGDPLTSRNGRGMPNDRYQLAVPSCLDPENTKPGVVIMERNALDETGEN